jgi:hypothetical protein
MFKNSQYDWNLSFLLSLGKSTPGCASAQAINRWFFTAENRVKFQGSPEWICVAQGDNETCASPGT